MRDLNDRLAPNRRGISFEDLGDEIVIYDETQDEIHVLNDTAALIWRKLENAPTGEEVLEMLLAEYPDEDPATLKQDLTDLIEDLDAKGLLEDRPEGSHK